MREKDGRQRLTANRFGAIGRGVTDTNVPIPGPSFDPGAERLPCRKPGAGLPRRNRCGPGRAPEPSPAATAPRGRGGSLHPPDSPPEAAPDSPPGRARDGASARAGGGRRHRKPLGRSVAAAARRAAAAALLLLAATLGRPPERAQAQTATSDLMTIDPIAGDDTLNIAEKAAGFTISGDFDSDAFAKINFIWDNAQYLGGNALLLLSRNFTLVTSATSARTTWSWRPKETFDRACRFSGLPTFLLP